MNLAKPFIAAEAADDKGDLQRALIAKFGVGYDPGYQCVTERRLRRTRVSPAMHPHPHNQAAEGSGIAVTDKLSTPKCALPPFPGLLGSTGSVTQRKSIG
jgi:hypothetical protein